MLLLEGMEAPVLELLPVLLLLRAPMHRPR